LRHRLEYSRLKIYLSYIYNSYKAKPHYSIFLQFCEATSSQGLTKLLSSVTNYTSTKYYQEMKRPRNNWCKTIEEPRGHVIVMVFIHHVQHVTPHNRLKFHHTASSPQCHVYFASGEATAAWRVVSLHHMFYISSPLAPVPGCLLSCRGECKLTGIMLATDAINKFRSRAAHSSSSSVTRESIPSTNYILKIVVRNFSLFPGYC